MPSINARASTSDHALACPWPAAAQECLLLRKRAGGRAKASWRRRQGIAMASLGDVLGGVLGGVGDLTQMVPPADVDLSTVSNFATTAMELVPEPLRPIMSLLADDVMGLISLQPTTGQIGRLGLIYYILFTTPAPLIGIMDYYILGPLGKLLQRRWKSEDFVVRNRLGGGNFGTTYEAIVSKGPGESVAAELTPEQKNRRVVLKKVNLDSNEIRGKFLGGGTIARGAGETGQAEAYMYSKIGRNPLVKPRCANYKGVFFADQSDGGFTVGSQWLVWDFESDATLSDALEGPQQNFPECLQQYVLRNGVNMSQQQRDSKVIKRIMKKILTGLTKLHSLGIVHRDIKPANLLVTVSGDIKIIDFGAAVDVCTGVNFNPAAGMLDPRYCPPEEVIVPRSFPNVQPPLLAALVSPLVWWLACPNLFDTYSAGMILVQMSIPELRSTAAQKGLVADLEEYSDDLRMWRAESPRARNADFSLLDMNSGAGWDLACKLVCRRNGFMRGRLSAEEALGHRYFFGFF
ncbi:unnamed protein product [Ostreobium quekettii]|uniref:Protein kinase domain-containing protein n=1 Tax=Ostreobium quekettii TaxID=121088 RepID=A0A8S1J302_9CHLO|nr:unnamed protein product [Ostreobium quekettii]|eukprot:evm.model.scf_2445.2 EVM.evm.TU.scf_2445.2   scf_2445:4603-10845(+)